MKNLARRRLRLRLPRRPRPRQQQKQKQKQCCLSLAFVAVSCLLLPSSGSSSSSQSTTLVAVEQQLSLHKHGRGVKRFLDQEAQGNQEENGEDNEQNKEEDEANQVEEDDRLDEIADDRFDDQVQDDQLGDDYHVRVYDDYYLFQEDPGPPTLFPLTLRELLGYSIASLAIFLGATGGIGGGGILVPTYMLVTGLSLRDAVPISAVTVLGGSLGSTMINCGRRHPLADRPIIDWDLVLVMEPLILVGTILGTIFHKLFSEKFLVVLLVLLLSTTAHTTLNKAMRMYQAEKRYIRHLKAAQSEPPSGSSPPRNNYTWNTSNSAGGTLDKSEDDDDDGDGSNQYDNNHTSNLTLPREEKERILILNPDYVTLRSDLIQEEKFTPCTKIAALVLMFSVVLCLNIMVGGGAYESPWGIDCGSFAFWTAHFIMLFFLISSAWVAHTYVVARHEIKQLVRFDYVHGDINWNTKQAILYPLTFIGAGFFAGTLGIGGGVITVPLMLHFGMHPAVAAASSSCMIFFTSFASSSMFTVFGLLLPDFALVGFCVGFLGALAGQSIMRQARQATSASGRNFERNSYTAFVIGGVILISALLMTIQYVLIIVERPEDYDGGLCEGYRF